MRSALTIGPSENPFFWIPATQKIRTRSAQPIMPTRQLVHCLMSTKRVTEFRKYENDVENTFNFVALNFISHVTL